MKKWFLPAIILLALFLRIPDLANTPAGFTPDEASFGYDAYSLLKTGKDQWGTSWPLTFRSFGDFKLPLYTYLAIPSVAVFGLNEFATRLPGAVIGVLAVISTYYFVKQFSKNDQLAYFSALLLAISPWHVMLSRGAFEANLTSFFIPAGLYFFFKGLKNEKYYYLTALLFGINLFTYHSARLLTPLIAVFLAIHYRKELFNLSKVKLLAALLFVSMTLIAAVTMFGGGATRASTAGIFNPTEGWENVAQDRYLSVLVGEPNTLARIFHNKLTYVGAYFFRNYFSYFSPQFLFTQGPSEATYGMVPGQGVLYIFEMVFLGGFIYGVIKGKITNVKLIVFWLLISPLAPALAKGVGFAANRASFALPAISIISAMGAFFLLNEIERVFKKNRIVKSYIYASFTVISILSFAFFAQTYIVDQKSSYSNAMIYGMRDLMTKLSTVEGSYDEIFISKKVSEPQIYVAFYNTLDPTVVQEESKDWIRYEKEGRGWVDQLGKYGLGKYKFTSLDNVPRDINNVLIVGSPIEFPSEVNPIIKVDFPAGDDAYWGVVAPYK